MAQSKLQILLEVDDKGTPTIRALGQSLDDVTKSTDKAESGFDGITSTIGKLALGVGAVVGAFYAAKKAMDFGREGAEIERLEQSGRALAESFDLSMDEIIAAMRRGSDGTVSNLSLIRAANRALQLGVAQTPEDFERLTRAAIALGRAMGRTASESIDDIVTGIGRMSPLILDNLGIVTKGGKVFDEYAASIGKTALQLDDSQRKQVLLNMTVQSAQPLLSGTGELVDDLASSYERLGAQSEDAFDRLKKAAGRTLQPVAAGLAEWFERGNEVSDWAQMFPSQYEQVLIRAAEGNMTWAEALAPFEAFVTQTFAAAAAAATLGPQIEAASSEGVRFRTAMESAGEGLDLFFDKANATATTLPDIWAGVLPDPQQMVARINDTIAFIEAGGPELVAAIQKVQQAVASGALDPAAAKPLLDELSAGAAALSVEIGDATNWEAAKKHAEDTGKPFGQALQDVLDMRAELDALPARIIIEVQLETGQLPGYQHGGRIVVGGHGQPDSKLMVARVSPGETIDFIPPGAGRAGATVNFYGGMTVRSERDLELIQMEIRRALGG